MPKFAIYTAVVGSYDEIRQPLVVDSRFDYFLFSDTIKVERIGVWQIKPIEYTNPDRVKIARYVKTHPETLLPDYAATLWMDANIQIIDTWVYERFSELYQDGSQIASVKHPDRDCIYEELFTICSLQWETIETAWKWNRVLRQNKYPEHNGLFETGVTYRLNSPSVKRVDEDWWKFVENYSKRDQLSFNFALWGRGVNCTYFFANDEHALNSPHFDYQRHDSIDKKQSEDYFIERLWNYYWLMNPKRQEQFKRYWLQLLSLPYECARYSFYLWRQLLRVRGDILFYYRKLAK